MYGCDLEDIEDYQEDAPPRALRRSTKRHDLSMADLRRWSTPETLDLLPALVKDCDNTSPVEDQDAADRLLDRLGSAVLQLEGRIEALLRRPGVQVTLNSAFLGALVTGCLGGSVGSAVGGAAGTIVGVVPAPLTFGLSIPVAATLGCIGGQSVGLVVGTTSGMVGGATIGGLLYGCRLELRRCCVRLQAQSQHLAEVLERQANAARDKASAIVAKRAIDVLPREAQRRLALTAEALEGAVCDPKHQVVALSAGAGALSLGVSGAAIGLLAGTVSGAICGLAPAAFTFGLSVPIGAIFCGGGAMAAGAAAGATAGLAGGGAVGYVGYATRSAEVALRRARVEATIDRGQQHLCCPSSLQTGPQQPALLARGGTGGTV
eukprot:TRINITY_DN26988_c0_g1_i1.p1 TRINITY_DN26988_c0_g1~~TRINITY_DN26988_c0_g1_i1.p1  ORF type:complete len:377 (+),score=82.10 TRINITY_DN26988_c0_g1_i1:91-1221(+)